MSGSVVNFFLDEDFFESLYLCYRKPVLPNLKYTISESISENTKFKATYTPLISFLT